MTTTSTNQGEESVGWLWILFSLFIPVLPIIGEAFLSYNAGYLLFTGGILVVTSVYSVLFIDSIARSRALDPEIIGLGAEGNTLVNVGLLRLLAVGGAFFTSFAPAMMMGAVILESMHNRSHLSAMSALAYVSSVLVGAAMMKVKPWLAGALEGIEFAELVASYFASAFVLGVIAYLIAQQFVRLIGSPRR